VPKSEYARRDTSISGFPELAPSQKLLSYATPARDAKALGDVRQAIRERNAQAEPGELECWRGCRTRRASRSACYCAREERLPPLGAAQSVAEHGAKIS